MDNMESLRDVGVPTRGPFTWSGKLRSTLVTSHWRLSHLPSGSLSPLFRISTVSMCLEEEKSPSNQLARREQEQWFCVPGWPRPSSHDRALLGLPAEGKLIKVSLKQLWWLLVALPFSR